MSFEKGKAKLKKGKQGFFRVLFSRTAVFGVLLLGQIWFLILVVGRLTAYSVPIYAVAYALSLCITIAILNKDDMNPAFKLVWLLPVVGMPMFGVLLYLFLTMQPQTKIIQKKLRAEGRFSRSLVNQNPDVMKELQAEDGHVAGLAHYVNHCSGMPVYYHTESRYLPTGEEAFEVMKKELRKAKHFIFVEYFILREGRMLSEVLDILEEKVKEGVEVRFIYDGLCSLTTLPYGYIKKVQERGIDCRIFAPAIPALSTYQNNRDHRKILVIDNQVAFTGGINLADEYINEWERFGYWKDNAILIRGEAVSNFTVMFLQTWHIMKKTERDYAKYLVPYEGDRSRTSGFVLPYADSPLDGEPVAENVYMSILAHAERYVHIMTPYLILDHETMGALKMAAKRGVDVEILMPHIPDKKYAFWLAKTYYKELMESGVKIYEFTPGFVHSKVFVSDDDTAVVGTINLDYRSLYLHYECAVYMYQTGSVAQVEEDFQDSIAKSMLVTKEYCESMPFHVRFFGKVLRIVAPLM